MHNSPAVSSAKSFDLTSMVFLIVAFLTGIAGALQTPTLSIFLTDEVHARPAMVGFFFTGSAVIGILVSQFLAGRSDKRGDRKSLIVFCCLLGVLACTLFAWNRNYFVLLFVGVFLSCFGRPLTRKRLPLPVNMPTKPDVRSGDVQLFFTRSGFTGMVIGPPLAYALAMGFSFTGNVSERSSSVYCLRRDACGRFYRRCKKSFRWRPARLKRRAVTVAIRCCCLSFVH
ncbi:MFS transporter [Escherichia coli]